MISPNTFKKAAESLSAQESCPPLPPRVSVSAVSSDALGFIDGNAQRLVPSAVGPVVRA